MGSGYKNDTQWNRFSKNSYTYVKRKLRCELPAKDSMHIIGQLEAECFHEQSAKVKISALRL